MSAINGCGMCIDSHEKVLRAHGVSAEAVQAAVRIAAVVHAVAATLDGVDAAASCWQRPLKRRKLSFVVPLRHASRGIYGPVLRADCSSPSARMRLPPDDGGEARASI